MAAHSVTVEQTLGKLLQEKMMITYKLQFDVQHRYLDDRQKY